jgi:FMN-dependent NADH-azoreductase
MDMLLVKTESYVILIPIMKETVTNLVKNHFVWCAKNNITFKMDNVFPVKLNWGVCTVIIKTQKSA